MYFDDGEKFFRSIARPSLTHHKHRNEGSGGPLRLLPPLHPATPPPPPLCHAQEYSKTIICGRANGVAGF